MADRVSNRIIQLSETASTNEVGLRLALAGEELPLWVTARRQTSGRGRAGRAWVSLEGNLHASFVMRTLAPLTCAGQIALVAGVALADAVLAIARPHALDGIRLKWPNDLLIGRAKLGGILVETTPGKQSPGFIAVIGFGLNIAACPPDLEAACLTQHGVSVITRTDQTGEHQFGGGRSRDGGGEIGDERGVFRREVERRQCSECHPSLTRRQRRL